MAATRRTLLAVALFSCMVNILMLTGPLFMLQVYDRVLPSGSLETLMALFALVVGLYLFMGALDLVRLRILARIGHRLEEEIGGAAFAAEVRAALGREPAGERTEPVSDVDRLRQFATSAGAVALFDMPWVPVYVAVVYLVHPFLGHLAAAGALVLLLVAVATDRAARARVARGVELSGRRNALVAAGRRNADVLSGMGMLPAASARYDRLNDAFLSESAGAADIVALSGVVSKVTRLFLQSAILALGAWLAIAGAITPGAMIAASIIMARGLQPVETAVSNWRQLLSARGAARRLGAIRQAAGGELPLALPAPSEGLEAEELAMTPPGAASETLSGVDLVVAAGTAVGVIGPSGSGKSTLARALVGVWPPTRGEVRLDGAPLSRWPPEALGRHVGYLPQDVELFDGTVAENIARFRDDATDEAVVAAATAAGCNDMILSLPEGYATPIGDDGARLSAGQRQRVALARALFGDPFLLVLDEPNAHLDGTGEAALHGAIVEAKRRGAVVIVVAHRPSALSAADRLAVLEGGRLKDFGERDAVLARALRPARAPRKRPGPTVRVVRPERP